MIFAKGRGGKEFSSKGWNDALQHIEDTINALEGENFSKFNPIDETRFVENYLRRLDVSSGGGGNKVLEHNNNGDLSLSTNDTASINETKIISSSSDTFITFDGLQNRIEFTANSVLSVFIDSTGWN